ncbi:integrin alpha-L-like [Rhinophrynus dorsalis]
MVRGEPGVTCNQVTNVGDPIKGPQDTANKIFVCLVEKLNVMNIHVEGKLQITQKQKTSWSVSVSSSVTMHYNESRYHSEMGRTFHTAQVVTQVELLVPPNMYVYAIGGGVGGGILLLLICGALYKCGFFKRRQYPMEEAVTPACPKEPEVTEKMEHEEPLTSGITD